MSQRLKNKVALITGAAQGLGKEMASSMITEGAEVILSDVNETLLEKTAKEFSSSFFKLDVTNDYKGSIPMSYSTSDQLHEL